jgi:hydroxyacylglutathione hydrolase
MVIERWTGPPVETHTYLVGDEASGEAWVIDAPLDTAEPVLARVGERGFRLSRVILTHGHFDHILDAAWYQAAGIPIALHALDQPMLRVPQTTLFGLPHPMPEIDVDEEPAEGSVLRLGTREWRVWHVPGHSPGHVVLHCADEGIVLGGDVLFRGGYGRVDLPGSDAGDMSASLLRLLELPSETRVLPGHGPETTIGAERGWLEPLLSDPRGVQL